MTIEVPLLTDVTDPVTGRRIRRLTDGPMEHLHAYYDIVPWSPDGTKIVYSAHRPGAETAEIWVMDADGGRQRKIADHPTFDPHSACGQKWLDDRTVILPVSGSGGGAQSAERAGLRKVDVETGDEETVLLPGGISKLSPDGRYGVAFGAGDVGLVELATGDYQHIATLDEVRAMSPYQDVLATAPTALINPRWAPDSRKVMICNRAHDQPLTLHSDRGTFETHGPPLVEMVVFDLDTRELRYLARVNHHPTWHPNGTDILYVGRDAVTGRQDLRLIDWIDAKERIAFDAEHVPAGHPLYHPGNTDLLVTDAFGGTYGYGIVLVDLAAQTITPLATQPFGEVPATSSGTHYDEPWNWHCWSYPRYGFPGGVGYHPHPAWNADGSRLLYHDNSTGHPQLHLLDTSDLAC